VLLKYFKLPCVYGCTCINMLVITWFRRRDYCEILTEKKIFFIACARFKYLII